MLLALGFCANFTGLETVSGTFLTSNCSSFHAECNCAFAWKIDLTVLKLYSFTTIDTISLFIRHASLASL